MSITNNMKKRTSTAMQVVDFRIEDVWSVITNNKDWKWRTDLENLKIINSKEFIEYGKGGFEVRFRITKKEKYKVYAFDMDSEAFFGKWTGKFKKLSNEKTKITFTESIIYKKLLYKIFASLFVNLRKIQDTYMRDLKKKLKEKDKR